MCPGSPPLCYTEFRSLKSLDTTGSYHEAEADWHWHSSVRLRARSEEMTKNLNVSLAAGAVAAIVGAGFLIRRAASSKAPSLTLHIYGIVAVPPIAPMVQS